MQHTIHIDVYSYMYIAITGSDTMITFSHSKENAALEITMSKAGLQ